MTSATMATIWGSGIRDLGSNALDPGSPIPDPYNVATV